MEVEELNCNSQSDMERPLQVESKISIKTKILRGDCILVEKNGSSVVWQTFKNVMYNDEKHTYTGFVVCVKCSMLFKYNYSTGTSTLSRHKCAITNIQKGTQSSMDSFVSKRMKTIPEKLKSECIDKCVRFCSLDIRPMTTIAGPGFKELGQFLIKVGSQHGPDININDLMPHPTTITTNTIKMASNHRNALFENILPFIQTNSCAMTTDDR